MHDLAKGSSWMKTIVLPLRFLGLTDFSAERQGYTRLFPALPALPRPPPSRGRRGLSPDYPDIRANRGDDISSSSASGSGRGTHGAILASRARSSHHACTLGRKDTVRSVPEALNRAVRYRARMKGKSINSVIVEALACGLDLRGQPAEYTDLGHLIGTWQEGPEFDRAVEEFGRVDDAWK